MSSHQNRPTEGFQKVGKGMLYIFWLLVLVGLTYVAGLWEDEQINPNQRINSQYHNQTIEIRLERNRFNHYVANGLVNGTPVTFMLDTGATDVAIPSAVAKKIGLPQGRSVNVNTANGLTTAYRSEISELTLGDIQLYNVRASIVPNMQGEQILLGMSALKQVEFHQSGNFLTIRYTP